MYKKLGFWAIDKQMNNFVNDLQFSYKFDKGNVTAGFINPTGNLSNTGTGVMFWQLLQTDLNF